MTEPCFDLRDPSLTGVGSAEATGPAPLAPAATSDDSRAGLAMFLIFTAAVLIVTGTGAVLAVVGTWWMLAVGFALHVAVTFVVMLTIVEVMAGRDRVIGRVHRVPPAHGGRLSHAPWLT